LTLVAKPLQATLQTSICALSEKWGDAT
jgi:hypothetical protein